MHKVPLGLQLAVERIKAMDVAVVEKIHNDFGTKLKEVWAEHIQVKAPDPYYNRFNTKRKKR